MPSLTLLAGPNGAGKTTFIERFKKLDLLPDKVINLDNIPESVYKNLSGNIYNADSQLQKLRHEFFNEQCMIAIKKNVDFAYECNLRIDQLQQVRLFEDAGYSLNLIYMYLQSIDISFNRVQKRIKQKGHSVPIDSIKENYYTGLSNLNKSYNEWDTLYIIDNSKNLTNRKNNLQLELIMKKGVVTEKMISNLSSIKNYIPNIFSQL